MMARNAMKRVHAGILLAASCLLILSWLDHHAAEYDPRHTHLAQGLLGVALDRGLIPHEHAFATEHSHDDEPEPAISSDVNGEKISQTAPLYAAGRGSAVVTLSVHDAVAKQLRAIDKALTQISVWFAAIDLDILDPPPRPI